MNIQTIGVVGAGTMGNGIAQVCAAAGLGVVMVDLSTEAVQRGFEDVSISLDRLIRKGKLTGSEKGAIVGRIKGTTSYVDLAPADIVVAAGTSGGNPAEGSIATVETPAIIQPDKA
jgi:3-hydroxybutyryl-CoA dehydrogenase